MQINVGTVLTMSGKQWYCISIEVYKKTLLAGNWDVTNWSGCKLNNWGKTRVLAQESCNFDLGDIYTREYEKLELKEVNGMDWMSIYTYHKVKRENSDHGSKRAESGTSEASDSQAEVSR